MQGFISYAHEDHAELTELRKHLRAMERAHGFTFWTDRDIDPGQLWNHEIQRAIASADVLLVLLSPAVGWSDYICTKEIPAILDRYQAGALVLPVLVKGCLLEYLLPALETVPTTEAKHLRPIIDWQPQRHGYERAARQIANALTHHYGPAQHIPLAVTSPGPVP